MHDLCMDPKASVLPTTPQPPAYRLTPVNHSTCMARTQLRDRLTGETYMTNELVALTVENLASWLSSTASVFIQSINQSINFRLLSM